MNGRRRLASRRAALLVALAPAGGAAEAADPDPAGIFFPVQAVESLSYVDSFGDPRGGGRRHLGVDLMAAQMTPVFAARDGEIAGHEDRCDGAGGACTYYLLLRGDDGRMYFYAHLNEDTPGRPAGCDHAGGIENAYAPRLHAAWEAGELDGLPVRRGEHLGWTGSSGNAGCGVDHLHFEAWPGDDWSARGPGSLNPYPMVRDAREAGEMHGAGWTAGPGPRAGPAGAERAGVASE